MPQGLLVGEARLFLSVAEARHRRREVTLQDHWGGLLMLLFVLVSPQSRWVRKRRPCCKVTSRERTKRTPGQTLAVYISIAEPVLNTFFLLASSDRNSQRALLGLGSLKRLSLGSTSSVAGFGSSHFPLPLIGEASHSRIECTSPALHSSPKFDCSTQ